MAADNEVKVDLKAMPFELLHELLGHYVEIDRDALKIGKPVP